jgi:hypothetical protein
MPFQSKSKIICIVHRFEQFIQSSVLHTDDEEYAAAVALITAKKPLSIEDFGKNVDEIKFNRVHGKSSLKQAIDRRGMKNFFQITNADVYEKNFTVLTWYSGSKASFFELRAVTTARGYTEPRKPWLLSKVSLGSHPRAVERLKALLDEADAGVSYKKGFVQGKGAKSKMFTDQCG